MTELTPYTISLAIPDLDTAPDEIIEAILRTRDGRWSRQTKAMLAKYGTERLALNRAWASTPMSWLCPCCQRYKPDIARVTDSGFLLCQLDDHHDHLNDRAKAIFRRDNPWPEDPQARGQLVRAIDSCRALIERFATTLLCIDCNAAEGAAKIALKDEIDSDFSFSPKEIAAFITGRPNQVHDVDVGKACQIWTEVQPVFVDLVAFAGLLSQRVAAGRHRKEGRPHWGLARSLSDPEIVHHLLVEQAGDRYRPYRLAGQLDARSRSAAGAGASTRPKRKTSGQRPSSAEYERLDAERVGFAPWRKAVSDWRCEVCDRNKLEIFRKSNAGLWTGGVHEVSEFEVETDPENLSYRLSDRGRPVLGGHRGVLICHDCRNVIAEIKRRCPGLTDWSLTLADLRDVITEVSPNSRHGVDFPAAIERG